MVKILGKKQNTPPPRVKSDEDAEDNIPPIGKPGDEMETPEETPDAIKPEKIESPEEPEKITPAGSKSSKTPATKFPVWIQFEAPDKEGHKIIKYQGKALKMREHLVKQPLKPLYIPRADGENPKIKLSVTLNRYCLLLPKNADLEVPEQIAQIVKRSRNQVSQAYAQIAEELGMDRPTSGEKTVPFNDALN